MPKPISSREALQQIHKEMVSIRKEKPSRKQIARLSAAIEIIAALLERQANLQ